MSHFGLRGCLVLGLALFHRRSFTRQMLALHRFSLRWPSPSLLRLPHKRHGRPFPRWCGHMDNCIQLCRPHKIHIVIYNLFSISFIIYIFVSADGLIFQYKKLRRYIGAQKAGRWCIEKKIYVRSSNRYFQLRSRRSRTFWRDNFRSASKKRCIAVHWTFPSSSGSGARIY